MKKGSRSRDGSDFRNAEIDWFRLDGGGVPGSIKDLAALADDFPGMIDIGNFKVATGAIRDSGKDDGSPAGSNTGCNGLHVAC